MRPSMQRRLAAGLVACLLVAQTAMAQNSLTNSLLSQLLGGGSPSPSSSGGSSSSPSPASGGSPSSPSTASVSAASSSPSPSSSSSSTAGLPASFFAPIGGSSASPSSPSSPSGGSSPSPSPSTSSPSSSPSPSPSPSHSGSSGGSSPSPSPSSSSGLPSSFFSPIGGGSSTSSSSSSGGSSSNSSSSSSSSSPATMPPSPSPTVNLTTGVATSAPSGSSTSPPAASNNTAAPSSSGTAAAADTGGFGLSTPPAPALPPAPPADWSTLTLDTTVTYQLVIRGPYIVPFTQPKAYIVGKVLHDRYLRSTQPSDISVQAMNTFTYLDYNTSTNVDAISIGGRRLQGRRDLLQVQKSGANLQIRVNTAQQRVQSEIQAVTFGVDNGTLAADLTLAGVTVDNVTMDGQPQVTGLITNNSNSSSSSGMQGWAIAIIVIVVLLVVPVPAYFWVRSRKAKRKAAQEQQAAEAAAVRARMESRTGMRGPGGKSFTLGGKGGAGAVDIMVRSGSVGGMGLGYGPPSARWGAPREGSMASLANGLPAGGMGAVGAAALASGRGPPPPAGVVPSLAGTAPFAAGIAGAHALPHHGGAAGDDDASDYSGSEYSSEDEGARR